MGFDFESLRPSIRQILSAPGTDLATISAKRVRRQLTDVNPSLTIEWMKEHRDEVDHVIASVYESVRDGVSDVKDEEENASETSRKRGRSDDDAEEEHQDGDEEVNGDATPPPPTKKVKKGKLELDDEKLARQIASELNGGGRRSNTRTRATNGSTPKKPRKKKSTATVDSDGGSDGEDDGTKKSKRKGGAAKGGFAKEYTLSEPLASLLQVEKMSRPQVVKRLWEHIKANELQNPSNRKEILCDAGMKAVFKSDKIDMFSMNKTLGAHLYRDDA
ncbi:hypothetical protein ONZ45_g3172 [Pleurotus djamor]|nr:hypothetical protein ONZ45_g3172 [Pleurotus djamor]